MLHVHVHLNVPYHVHLRVYLHVSVDAEVSLVDDVDLIVLILQVESDCCFGQLFFLLES